MATDRPTAADDPPVTADELEQRQDLHGRLDELDQPDPRHAVPEGPISPDVIEQHQRLDGSLERPGTFDAPGATPLDPEVVEQQRSEEDQDEEDVPAEDQRDG
jgi:hypothetical protein